MHTTVCFALAATLFALGCGPQPPGQTPAKGARDPSITSLDDADAMQIYYQFVDERGRVRFVTTLAEVPPDWRSKVGFVEMSSPPPDRPADARRLREKHTARVATRSRASAHAGDNGGNPNGVEVIIYSADWCGVCTRAKRYMDGKGISYDERNVDEEQWAKEMRAKAGSGGIPVFDVGGEILRGFSQERLDQMIAKAS